MPDKLNPQNPSFPTEVKIKIHEDERGSLGVVEGESMPFSARRLYFLFDMKKDVIRGEHAHKNLKQVLVCLAGSVEVMIWDGHQETFFQLNSRDKGIYVPPGFWRQITPHQDGSIIAVLASDPYDVEDYIFTKQEYLEFVGQNPAGEHNDSDNIAAIPQ